MSGLERVFSEAQPTGGLLARLLTLDSNIIKEALPDAEEAASIPPTPASPEDDDTEDEDDDYDEDGDEVDGEDDDEDDEEDEEEEADETPPNEGDEADGVELWGYDSITHDGGVKLNFRVKDADDLLQVAESLRADLDPDNADDDDSALTVEEVPVEVQTFVTPPGQPAGPVSRSGVFETRQGEALPSPAFVDGIAVPPDSTFKPPASVLKNRSLRMGACADGARLDPMNIVILIVGTRGDVQPFIGIGRRLLTYGHRVRLATHAVYRSFVETAGLEFFPLGGDPKVLSEFVVKHRGLLPGWAFHEVVNQRNQVRDILASVWPACTAPDPERPDLPPFTAQAIVSNPPVYGHIHVAEKLNIPLHMVFTMPWTPTTAYPCPFARVETNYKTMMRSGTSGVRTETAQPLHLAAPSTCDTPQGALPLPVRFTSAPVADVPNNSFAHSSTGLTAASDITTGTSAYTYSTSNTLSSVAGGDSTVREVIAAAAAAVAATPLASVPSGEVPADTGVATLPSSFAPTSPRAMEELLLRIPTGAPGSSRDGSNLSVDAGSSCLQGPSFDKMDKKQRKKCKKHKKKQLKRERLASQGGARVGDRLTGNLYWLSYFAMEDLTWLGISDLVSEFRIKTLGLGPLKKKNAAHALYYSKVPFSYIWSPSLVPAPPDWEKHGHIRVVGFVNVQFSTFIEFKPEKELADFLAAGDPPLFISFGSLVMPNPQKLTTRILRAVWACQLAHPNLRVIIQRGWGGLGTGVKPEEMPPNVLFIDACPHDWLFPRCRAVIHHGGAGTTATGLFAAKPTLVVPFFGDQPFWGAACCAMGVGPKPLPIDRLNTPRLIKAIMRLLDPKCEPAAQALAAAMLQEDGAAGAVDHIHRTIYCTAQGSRRLPWMRVKAMAETALGLEVREGHNGKLKVLLRGAAQRSGLKGVWHAVKSIKKHLTPPGSTGGSLAGSNTAPLESTSGDVNNEGSDGASAKQPGVPFLKPSSQSVGAAGSDSPGPGSGTATPKEDGIDSPPHSSASAIKSKRIPSLGGLLAKVTFGNKADAKSDAK